MAASVNMRDVAQAAGVSIATVSKSLTNKSDVSEATRKRVLATCRRLGYTTNPLVAALMRSRRRRTTPSRGLTLAYITAFPTADGWKTHPAPIFQQLFAGAAQRAQERNYRLEHHWAYQGGISNERFSGILEARGIRGLLFAPMPDAHTSITLDWRHFSVVVLGLTPSLRQFHRVTTDYYQSMLLVMQKCREAGFTRPGFAARSETAIRLERRWEAAFRIAQFDPGFVDHIPPLLVDQWTPNNVRDWLHRYQPDVVIGPVLGRLEELIRESRKLLPSPVGLAGLLVPHPGDRLSGILQDGEVIGATAVDQLISQLERNETGVPVHPITHTMLGRWNPGRTLPRRG